jgi:hypothetical protein
MGVPRTEFCRQADASLLSGRLVLEVIENHLLRLGGRNHSDNMERLRRFKCHYSVSLVGEEFFELVFLQIDEVLRIAPRGDDRTLRAVARRAINLGRCTYWLTPISMRIPM